MKEFLDRIQQLPPRKLALLAAQLRDRLDRVEAAGREPIAICGIGCRFPGGADDPESYWRMLDDRRDAVRETPADRWDSDALYDADVDAPGKLATRFGGYLDDVDRFDAALFGIAPREAVSMDPQQRLLLETAWQALERAAIAPGSLLGSRTGVFVGVSTADYFQLQLIEGLQTIDGYLASGCAPSVAAGRLAYTLGLVGPTMSVDTACSSSLVAIHLAAQALRHGECDAALAGGVNLILSPVTTIALSKAQMMAPDGRCKAFDARADGFVRGEGCGVLVLKRLSDALADGDPIEAVIRGSAINQDGRSNGLTAPNGPSQEAVIRAALASARLEPEAIGYVEAHGTGTSLGDPIEVQALGAALNAGKDAPRRLRIGSVKTNIGHLESAAGVAGLIKAVLAIRQRTIPAHLHLESPSPVIPWDRLAIDVPTEPTVWDAADGERLAGVSSFGFSGTNAHVIVGEAPHATDPADDAGAPATRSRTLIALSAGGAEPLRQLAASHAGFLQDHPLPLADVAATLDAGRDHFPHRVALTVDSLEGLSDGLRRLGAGETPAGAIAGHVTTHRAPKPVFLFTGQGAQLARMGADLYAEEPAAREILDRCDATLRERFDLPLLEVLLAENDPRLHETGFTQPALYALEIALAAVWRSWGIEPAAVLGHSVGELAAAAVAGLFSLDDGLTLIAERARLMQALPAGGSMAAVFADADTVQRALDDAGGGDVTVAAFNGPRNVVISGAAARVDGLLEWLERQGVRARRLEVSHAFHSPLMDPMLDEFARAASAVDFFDPAIPIVSNRTADAADPQAMMRAEYWCEHVRQPVRFEESIRGLVDAGHRLFLEIGPQPTLLGMAARCVDDPEIVWLPSLRKGRPDGASLAEALAQLYVRGARVDWAARERGRGRRRVMPTYPLQRERFWLRQGRTDWAGHDGGSPQAGTAPAGTVDADRLTYGGAWPARPHPSIRRLGPGTFLADPADLDVDAFARRQAEESGLAGYGRFLPDLDRLGGDYVRDAFRRLGWELRAGETYRFEALVEKLGVVRPHHRLLRRLLEMLTEDGWLAHEGSAWEVKRDGDGVDPAARLALLEADHPDFSAERVLLARCAAQLASVLRGQADPLQVLFPGGSTDETEAVYRDAPMARTFNAVVAETVAQACADRPAGRALRILEVGAGTGGTTSAVLPRLPRDEVEYVFTDVSPAFVTRARERFGDHPGLTGRTLDATTDPERQGFEPASFDLVLCANVVHATPDLEQTLNHLRGLLAPGGLLILLEATTRERFADLTVGFTEGWWAFRDTDRRPDYALLDRESWTRLLNDVGFESARALPAVTGDEPLGREAVLVARRPVAGAPGDVRAPDRTPLVVLAGEGARPVVEVLRATGRPLVEMAPGSGEAWERSLTRALVEAGDGADVVDVAIERSGPGLDDLRADQRARIERLLATVRAAADTAHRVRLWVVTQGGQPVTPGEAVHDEQATLWGVAHVAALEHPELDVRAVDLDPAVAAGDAAAALVAELSEPDPDEPQLAFRAGLRHVRRMARVTLGDRVPALDPEAVYVVSGGLRGIGLHVAGHLVARGARRLVLFGRSGADEVATARIEGWRRDGIDVRVEAADAASAGDVERVLATARSAGRLGGIVHNAGTLDDGAILQQDWSRFDTVFGPKVWGGRMLADAAGEVDFLILFSSGVGLVGAPGQANHAAANAWVDAFAARLRAAGRPVVSVGWGAWTGIGAAAERSIDSRPEAFSPDEALAVLDRVIAGAGDDAAPAYVAVRSDDWSELLGANAPGAEPPFYRDLARDLRESDGAGAAAPAASPAEADRAAGWLERLSALPVRRRRAELEREVRALAARVLDVDDPSRLEPGQPLHDMGLDSLMAVELRNALGKAAGRTFPATLLFEHPSVAALVDLLETLVAAGSDEVPAAEAAPGPSADPAPRPSPEPAASQASGPGRSATGPADYDEMSTEEMAARLAERLDRLDTGDDG